VCRVYPAGWPKIHHPLRLPSAPPVLAELLSEASRSLSGIPSHVTYHFATFLFVPFSPLLPLGVTLLPLFLSFGPKLIYPDSFSFFV